LRSYQAIPGVEVAAICDIDPARLDEIGDRYGVSERHTDPARITAHPDLDVISICSYDDAHAAQVVAALDHGKHVMVEKPVVLHPAEADQVLAALQRSSRFITSNLILRKSPRFAELKRQIEAGELGDIHYVEGDYIHQILWKITEGWRGKMDFYCTVYGGGIHLIDLMRWLLGREIVEVTALATDLPTRGSSFRFPDLIAALLRFDGGALGKTTTYFGPQRTKFHSLNVYGSRRVFINDLPNGKMFSGDRPEDEETVTTPYPGMEKGDMLPEFIQSIRENRRPPLNEVDIFRTMSVCFAIWESVQSGRVVPVRQLI
ncbi:MAG: Gfo/Idh/MocA family oxidoreductase, partial [Pseudomonadota bacterium]